MVAIARRAAQPALTKVTERLLRCVLRRVGCGLERVSVGRRQADRRSFGLVRPSSCCWRAGAGGNGMRG